MLDLYKNIERLCKRRGITITQMCRECGASRGSLGNLANGRIQTLSSNSLQRIASYFNVSVDYLVNNSIELDFVPHENERSILTCPVCGDEYTHFIKTVNVEFGNEKSSGIALEFQCEGEHTFYIVLETYKGYSHIVKTDGNCIIAKEMDIEAETAPISLAELWNLSEKKLVKKFGELDDYGKDLVTTVLDKEHIRCIEEKRYHLK